MIQIKNSEKNAIFLFIWLHNRNVPSISGVFNVKMESMDILKISEGSVKILSDGGLYQTLLQKLSKSHYINQGLEHVLQKLQTLSGAPICIRETTSRNGEETIDSSRYYSLERKNADGHNYYHCVTPEDLSYPHDEGSREIWVRAHCAVIEVLLRLWLQFQVPKKCLAQCLSKIVGQFISLDSTDDLRGADGALFWLVATAACSASLLGVKDCEKWLELHMTENTRWADADQQTDGRENNEVKKTDRFLRGVAIPNLVALVLCHYLRDYGYYAEFRMNFGKKGELPNADTAHNIDRILDISTRHMKPSVMDVLPAPRTAEGGLACEDFACGLARASPQRRLQAAALAGDLFYWAEVSKTSQSQNVETTVVGANTANDLVSGRHTYRLSKGVDKLLQATRTGSLDSITAAKPQLHARSASGHMSNHRQTVQAPSGNHALDVLFQRKHDGGPKICSPVFVGAATKLPPVPLKKPMPYVSNPAQGRQIKTLKPIPIPPYAPSGRQARSPWPSAEQTQPLQSAVRRELSEVPLRRRHVTQIPRPSSQLRYSRRASGTPLNPRDLNQTMGFENFEHYQRSLERLSVDLKKVQVELKSMAQHGQKPISSTVSTTAPQLLTSTTFVPVEDSQHVDVSLAIQKHQRAQVVAEQLSTDSSDSMEDLEEPAAIPQQEPKRPASQRRTWDQRITAAGPVPLDCVTCHGRLPPCHHHRTSLPSSPTLPTLHNLGQPICHTGCTYSPVKRSGRLRRSAVRRNRRIGFRAVETASSTEPESAGQDRSSVESEGICSETGNSVPDSPSNLLHARCQIRQEDERLLLTDGDTPKFERTLVSQPPPLSTAAEVTTWTSPALGSQIKSSPIQESGDRTIVKTTYASACDNQYKQRSSEVFVIDLNTIDRIGDLDVAAEGLSLTYAENHLSTRKARVLERCKRREEQRLQRRRAFTAQRADTTRREENNSSVRTSLEEGLQVTAKQCRQKRDNIFQAYIHKKASSAAEFCSPTVTCKISPVLSTVSDQANQSSTSRGPISSFRRPASCNNTPASDQPRLYVQPQTKSNRRVITNALIHCCLAGRVNEQLKVNILQELGRTDGQHFIILLRGGCQFSGLFRFEAGSEEMVRVGGTGPHRITSNMIERFYKYDSGSKAFSVIETTSHLSTVVDAVTLLRQTQAKLLRNQRQQHPRPDHQQSLPSKLSNGAALS
uniref:CKK domain-containing protein n=2 Tax=Schistocephalus solidus TaxID=70667 RepID=A0A0X3NJ46_SCHSO